MTKFNLTLIGVILLSGCHMRDTSQLAIEPPRKPGKMKFGPPPPGDARIVGEPVPGWKPEDMIVDEDAAGRYGNPLSWYPMGPRPILDEFWSGSDDASGRVVSLAVDPTNPNVVYAASASGGLWKTTDNGLNWEPKTDELSILNHGSVALDPSNPNVVYLGTGEYTTQSTGDGIFRSIDGGNTFVRIGTTSQVGSRCSRIAIDPTDGDIIHLTGNIGYARTLDGGATWTRPITGACSDVALNPNDPAIVYLARHSDGVYKSTNGGATFTKLTNGLPTTNIRRILISVAASNPDVVYAAFINTSSGLRGLYRTMDGGAVWTRLNNTPDFPWPQGWYDCFVGVDPTDENTVYCGGVFPTYAVAGVIKTTDGGVTWTDITFGINGSQLHPDQHAIAFAPDGAIWIGNDGGVWRSDDGGQRWINTNSRLMVTQNYNIAVHPTNPARVMGGTQDNGTVGRELETDEWPQLIGGDGGFLAYDHNQPSRRYTTYVFLTVFRRNPNGTWNDITGPWGGDPANFIAPLVMDPDDSRTLLGGTNRVWRTHNADAAATWTAISTSQVGGGGRLNAIAVGPASGDASSDNIYTGSTTGKIFFTSDASSWNDRSSGLPSSGVSDIMVDPTDTNVAYVSFYRSGSGRIFETIDAGVNWTNVTGSLPAGVTPDALAIDWEWTPPGMYLGSGSGVWVSLDDGET